MFCLVSRYQVGDFVFFLNAILHDKSVLTRAMLLLLLLLLLMLLLLLHGRKHTDNEQASRFGGRSCRSSSKQRK